MTTLYYFVGGPTAGDRDAFMKRLEAVGGPPRGWHIYPHLSSDDRALHLVEATTVDDIAAHLANFEGIYERGDIVEIIDPSRH
jgi:hypothetical protein